jgi:hypothetical protein
VTTTIPEGAVKKLRLEMLEVESFDTTAAAGNLRGTVAGHDDGTQLYCPVSYGGTCIITACVACPSEDTCN